MHWPTDVNLLWDAVAAYLDFCGLVADRAEASPAELVRRGAAKAETARIRDFLRHAWCQVGQIDQRLLRGEAVPHGERVFSVFEEHSRWISKGKAGAWSSSACRSESWRTGTSSSSATR